MTVPPRFPVPDVNQTKDLFEVFKFVNSAGEGLFFPLMLFAIWVIAFVGAVVEGRQASRAWIFANLFTAILAMLLVILNLLNPGYLYLLIFFIALGLVWMQLQNARTN